MKLEMSDEFIYQIKNKDKDIFKCFNTSKENVLRNNSNIKIYNGEWIKVKVNNFITHHVRPAETLEDISNQYNISIEKLKEDNNIENNKLFIGQRLKIFKSLA